VPYARPIANTYPADWFWLLAWHKVLSGNSELPGGGFFVEFDTDGG